MKKIIFYCLFIFLYNCTGYSPIFTSDQNNFYIDKIEISEDNKLIRSIIKNLKPYTLENGKQKLTLKLDLKKEESVIQKDSKGDPSSYEIKINLSVDIIFANKTKNINFEEKFTLNEQSNKFEFNQYKKSMEKNLLSKIFERLISELRLV